MHVNCGSIGSSGRREAEQAPPFVGRGSEESAREAAVRPASSSVEDINTSNPVRGICTSSGIFPNHFMRIPSGKKSRLVDPLYSWQDTIATARFRRFRGLRSISSLQSAYHDASGSQSAGCQTRLWQRPATL
jgi:hypothetical protein